LQVGFEVGRENSNAAADPGRDEAAVGDFALDGAHAHAGEFGGCGVGEGHRKIASKKR
jgi:hypothetical protein